MGEVVAILGAGGHGRDIAAIADAAGVDHVFYDDAVGSDPRPVMYEGWPYVVGVNDPAVRRRMAVGTEPATLIHPTATIDPSATISPGCVVGAGTHIGPATDLGPHTHIGAGCTITRTSVGAFTTIAPGVNVAGDVTIGEGCLIGVGSTVSNLVRIGDRVTVGAGAIVTRDIDDGVTVVCREQTATNQRGEPT